MVAREFTHRAMGGRPQLQTLRSVTQLDFDAAQLSETHSFDPAAVSEPYGASVQLGLARDGRVRRIDGRDLLAGSAALVAHGGELVDVAEEARVEVCVEPVTGAVTLAYSVFIPATVGVAENVTTPVAELYAVTVQLETTVAEVFK